ncbi:Amino acid permease family protein [Thermobacillus xylanilyticus]|jgi:amino acid efflux transporter|uniref:Amino acid permease family protein n=1 Tax=Thermobacillus xylanilyticus TaxID=76633 RepID=A0ABN7RJI6_THEXY|nr:amino acid permease [Thermobacillus xylanilyticus]CAG5077212.1 Amino acid permease family protein [Thermobacillus xylanilyticus]
MNAQITLPQAIALYIAAILGSGILFVSSGAATVAGPASLLSWIIMILFSFPLAYTFASLSRAFPDAGGAATFVRIAFGEHPGNLVGWFYFLTASVGQMIVAQTGAYYTASAFGLSAGETSLLACLILLLGGVSNHFGIRISGKVSLLFSSLLLGILLIAVVTTIPHVRPDQFSPFFANGRQAVGEAIVLIFWSFFGWEAICSLADRFARPEKDMVRSAMISAAITGAVFLALSFVTIGSGTYGSPETDSAPLGIMLGRSLGLAAQYATTVLAFIICTGTVNAYVASLAQLGYALSRDQAFPAWLQYQHPRTGTPTRVVWLVILFACAGIAVSMLFHVHFTQLLFIPNALGMVVYVLSMAAAVKIYRRLSLPWLSGLVSLVMLCAFIPFLGIHVMLPILVSILYILYKRKSMTRTIAIRRNGTRRGDGHADAT